MIWKNILTNIAKTRKKKTKSAKGKQHNFEVILQVEEATGL